MYGKEAFAYTVEEQGLESGGGHLKFTSLFSERNIGQRGSDLSAYNPSCGSVTDYGTRGMELGTGLGLLGYAPRFPARPQAIGGDCGLGYSPVH